MSRHGSSARDIALQHGAATRSAQPNERCDTALCARPERSARVACSRPRHGVRAQPRFLGCAHYAPNPVLTQCIVYSHCLEHCSWTLFMNTVHGAFKNKIK